MVVAVDARELAGQPTGVGRYLGRLLAQWGLMPDARAHRFCLYTHDRRIGGPPGLDAEIVVLDGTGDTFWEQTTLAAALRSDPPDVLFAPAYTAPLFCRCPVVLTVHDVSFAAHPEWFSWREGLRRRTLTRLSARRARRVLTVSAFSRGEIVRLLGVPSHRVTVIPEGLGLAPARANGDREPLVLFVGSIFERRHVPELVRAIAPLVARHPGARLAIVGANRTRPRVDLEAVARDAGVAGAVEVHDWIADEELASLYARASAFAFLSSYEGFGLTPLEALAAGAPPVLLDTPVARETCGDAAIYVADPAPGPVADALLALLSDTPVRRAVLAAAPAVLARYDWARAAADTLAVIEEAAGP